MAECAPPLQTQTQKNSEDGSTAQVAGVSDSVIQPERGHINNMFFFISYIYRFS